MRSTNFTSKWTAQAWLRAFLALATLFYLAHQLGLPDPSPSVASLPELCVFHRVTGLDCPGCGMTRAFVRLMQGDWQGALAFNPISLPLFALLIVLAIVPEERSKRFFARREVKAGAWVLVAGILVWWVWVRVLPKI